MSLKMSVSCAILILCFTCFHVTTAKAQCSVNVKNGMHKERPPMVVSLGDSPSYIYPTTSDPANLIFDKGQKVDIICPGETNMGSTKVIKAGLLLLNDNPLKGSLSSATIECVSDEQFKFADKEFDFKDISCEEKKRKSYNAIQKDVGEKCINGDRYSIGYDLGDHGFLETIDLCHDKQKARTLWAHGVVVPVNQDQFRQASKHNNNFKAGNLFQGMQMSTKGPYSLSASYDTLKDILGSADKADKFLSTKLNERKFLAKGHLVANADNLYKSEQDSTYFFANAVPMWQQINANPGNWFFVEEYVRQLAFEKQHELDIYVGGVSTLKLDNKEIYLYQTDDDEPKVPVPKVLYKCVLDKKTKEAICFLVVNNPYLTKAEVEADKDEFVICKKLKHCEKLTKNHDKAELGYLYCCNLRDFYVKNQKELGLEDVKPYLKFREMSLLS